MVKIKEVKQESAKTSFLRILKGSSIAIIATLVLLLIYACLLTYTKLNEKTTVPVIILVTAISIFIGSFFGNLKIKKNGLANGAGIGLIYIVTIYLLSSMVSGNFGFSILSLIMIIVSILTGAIGGVIGVNR